MITTSDAYKAAIKADTEETVFTAEFGFIPPGSVEGSTVAASGEADLSRLNQVNNTVRGMSAAWATFEPDRWLLDGSMSLIDPTDATQEIGFLSNELCGSDRLFIESPYIDYTLDAAYDLIGIMVYFDDQAGEYADSVTVAYYDTTDTQLKMQTFANDTAIALFDLIQTGVKRIRLTVNSWNKPYRMAKVPTIFPGQIFFLGNDTYSFDFTEAIKPFETSITMPEFTVKFDNSSKKFDIINPLGLMAFLRKKMKVTTQIGIKTSAGYEHVSTGDFYLYGWPDDSQEDAASLTCRPSMAFATQYYVAPGTGTQTVADAAAIIFANVNETYTIEAELQTVIVNQYIGDNITLLSAMGQLAVACCGYWQIGRDGTYNLRKWQYVAPSNDIDYDNAWEKPKISQKELVTSVNVKYYTWNSTNKNLDDTDNILSLADNTGEMIEVQSSFIPTKAQADIVAASALAYYALRLKFEESYRGDMSIETGDNVTLETDYGDSEVMILGHNLTWDESGLDGTIKGLGAV